MRRLAGTVVLVGVVAFGAAGCGDEEKTVRGDCGTGTYELSVEQDGGALDLSFEVEGAAPVEVWDMVIEQGDIPLLEGQSQTDDDGELDAEALANASDGSSFTVTATPPTGEACTASIEY